MKERTQAKLEQRMKMILATLIQQHLADPRLGFVTVQSIALSPELDSAKVYVSVLGGEGDRSKTMHALADAAGYLRREMGRSLHLRKLPALTFIFDDQIDVALKTSEAIRRARAEDDSAAHARGEGEE